MLSPKWSLSRLKCGILCLTLFLAYAFAVQAESKPSLKSPLRFREDHTFKIVNFGDIHWDRNNTNDQKTMKAMENILAAESPDFVMYTGDNCVSDQLDAVKQGYHELTAPVVRRHIPWALTLGNHDAEYGGLSRKDVFMASFGLEGNLSKLGPEDIHGFSNFILPVMDNSGKHRAALLYVLDSNAYYKRDGLECYDWIHQDQIQWYRGASEFYKNKNRGQYLPSYAFFHIPLQEFSLYSTNKSKVGLKQENVSASTINSGLMGTILDHHDIKAMFCGHDHVNDYIASFDGIWLGYVRGIGYNTYGKDGFQKGARVIVLKQNSQSFETWLRLENGEVVNRFEAK